MARSKTSVSARLSKLHTARPRIFSLPRGELLSSLPMARVLGVSWPTLRGWCDEISGFEDSGAFLRGAQGNEYEFCPVRTLWFLIEYFEAQRAEFAEKTQDEASRSGVHLDAGDEAESWEEVRGRVGMSITVTQAQERQKRTCQTELVKGLFWSAYEGWQNAIMGIRTRMDPNGQMTPAQREELNEQLRFACSLGRDGAEQAMKDFDAGIEQARPA
jgi:hypothetical protein